LNDLKVTLAHATPIDAELRKRIRNGIAIRKHDLDQLVDCL